MADYENKEKEAALFAPRERRNENAADFEGRMLINGEMHWVNMWRNKTRNGDEYFKVKLKPAQARAEQISRQAGFEPQGAKPATYGDLDDGEIPFNAEFR